MTSLYVQPLHKKRGRPPAIDPWMQVTLLSFPDLRSRRARYYKRNLLRAVGPLGKAAVLDLGRVKAGEGFPLPDVVLSALGEIPGKVLMIFLARECLKLRAQGWRAHPLAEWVRRQVHRYALMYVDWIESGASPEAMSPELAGILGDGDAAHD